MKVSRRWSAKKSSFGKCQNPNYDNEDIKIDTAPQRHEHVQEGRMQFVPRLSEGYHVVTVPSGNLT